MLIGDVSLTEKGLVLQDVDGSQVELVAQDAIDLADWINARRGELQKISDSLRTGLLSRFETEKR